MADISWNREQKQAIYAREGTVLVSAAAGSGKTAVLSQRVMEMLKPDEEGRYIDADRLLIVTFSNAALASAAASAARLAAPVYGGLDGRCVHGRAVALRAEVAHINRAMRRKRDQQRSEDCSACRSHFPPFVTLVLLSFHYLSRRIRTPHSATTLSASKRATLPCAAACSLQIFCIMTSRKPRRHHATPKFREYYTKTKPAATLFCENFCCAIAQWASGGKGSPGQILLTSDEGHSSQVASRGRWNVDF